MWDLHVTCEIYFIGSYEHIFDWENRNMFSLEIKWPVSYFVCVNVFAACGRLFGFLGCKRAHVSVFNVVIGFCCCCCFVAFFLFFSACECLWMLVHKCTTDLCVNVCLHILFVCTREQGGRRWMRLDIAFHRREAENQCGSKRPRQQSDRRRKRRRLRLEPQLRHEWYVSRQICVCVCGGG